MERNVDKALVIVDMQRGFMPASEGERLDLPGFGELAVEGGHLIVPNVNKLTKAFRRDHLPIATTQDWHPEETAHFSDEPNYVDTWPRHCVAHTSGALLHPDLLVAKTSIGTRFYKGDTPCESPVDDDSYSGANSYHIPGSDSWSRLTSELSDDKIEKLGIKAPERILLPDWLRKCGATTIYVVGLALGDGDKHKLCVDSTAADLKDQGFDVVLVTDAAEAVLPENREKCFKNLGECGVRLMTTVAALEEIGHEN